jgi:signal peptidase II
VADAVQESADRAYAWGPLSALGLAIAAATGVVDQAVKLWLVNLFELGSRDQVALMPWVDLVLTWNTGISYGLFPQEGAFGQWALLAFKAVVVAFLGSGSHGRGRGSPPPPLG